ncbi:MAG: hypothetical protein AAFX87_01000 [Bacteroidota bacterium]
MKTIISDTDTLLFEEGLNTLYQESDRWMAEIDLWKFEVSFFQKLLDRHSTSFDTIALKKELDHFQHLITYYGGELLDEYRHQTREHMERVKDQLSSVSITDEVELQIEHTKLKCSVDAFRKEFGSYKRSLFATLGGNLELL